ncbi:HTH CENPB-type domain-containing protein [Caerostris darwini]|uniref:HTH CENPB-type domain-containing protein n=1 Tax=Caerostris darwini TaxID=1538125 RepID=A0AAV4VIU3_9ARAC|nr:HTH CENPB-type domain-containing protein [Caerostris darwini]
MSGKRNSYTADFKLQVIAFAEKHNNIVAARHFSVNEKQVREWRKKRLELEVIPKSKKASRGHRPMFHALEEKLAAWIQESRMNGFMVTRSAIRIMAMNMLKQSEFAQSNPVNFVASVGWCDRFMNSRVHFSPTCFVAK